jgi:DNA-binding MarR family transcriptional regulator
MEDQSNKIVILLLRISAHLNRNGNRITGQFGLNQQQFVVLNEIVRHEPIMQKHLVSELIYEKSNISKIVKKLIKLDFIITEPWPGDGRALGLKATPKGKRVWINCMRIMDKLHKEWLKPLSKKDKEATASVLNNIYQLLQGDQD